MAILNKNLPLVLSASRMTDMPEFYPLDIIKETEKRINKGIEIHTLVLWTKYPLSLFVNPLLDYLKHLKSQQVQLYLQLTISGMGGVKTGISKNGDPLIIEPNSPYYKDSLKALPEVISLVGKPERIRLRIDPLVRLENRSSHSYSNLFLFPEILEAASPLGIKDFVFSFLEPGMHKKADRRFEHLGSAILSLNQPEREKTVLWINKLQIKHNVNIHACCVKGFPISKCIDGELLQMLHDCKSPVNLTQMHRRELCGCTHSIDIGGWPPKKCFSGCDYCYASPVYL